MYEFLLIRNIKSNRYADVSTYNLKCYEIVEIIYFRSNKKNYKYPHMYVGSQTFRVPRNRTKHIYVFFLLNKHRVISFKTFIHRGYYVANVTFRIVYIFM